LGPQLLTNVTKKEREGWNIEAIENLRKDLMMVSGG
jgi:hypothetical protein